MLEVVDFSLSFSKYHGGLRRESQQAIRCLDVRIEAGQIVAVVGQSGSGKSLLAHALLGLLPANAQMTGQCFFHGEELTTARIAALRGKSISLIPQTVSFLNPLLQVGVQVARAAKLRGTSKAHARAAAQAALARYDLPEKTFRAYPFQLSGGMLRRVLTAAGTIGGAELILADEPTNGLDSENVHSTLGYLRQLADIGKGVLLITHDLVAALSVADRVLVLCNGVSVEDTLATDFFRLEEFRHPYTRALWNAQPARQFMAGLPFRTSIVADGGCPFITRCTQRTKRCAQALPERAFHAHGWVRCWHA